jgi:hypothetical protein
MSPANDRKNEKDFLPVQIGSPVTGVEERIFSGFE